MSDTRLLSELSGEGFDLTNLGKIYRNLNAPQVYEQVIARKEGEICHLGPIIVKTGKHTGRAANDKFLVDEPKSTGDVWWGKTNKPIKPEVFENMFKRVLAYYQGKDVFVQDSFAGHDPAYRLPIRVITENAWHSHFANTMFIEPTSEELKNHKPEFTVLHAPHFEAIPEMDGTRSGAFILLNLSRRLVLIGGTRYGGEIKKSVFTILNYILPKKGVLSMHCSANIGPDNDVALFFGLSGTGKTTLSADPKRSLIGDDEHGWSDDGVFNFEGGCYAKVINLSAEKEPEIYSTTKRFGTIMENVVYDPKTRKLDLNDGSITENTRAAYPLEYIPNSLEKAVGGHPQNVIMLTADAFGVMPPISKLTPEQAMYHFISGYTAKVAGTEEGVTEPQATFSACFGAPFMVLHPSYYAELLAAKIKKHNATCWLVNTGWSGGPYGVGERMDIKHTRALLNAALNGSLNDVEFVTDPIFGVQVPTSCAGVPSEILNARNTWKDKDAFDKQATKLAGMFRKNFEQFESGVSDKVKDAAPSAV